jgi:hydroxyethylthiazole kinase
MLEQINLAFKEIKKNKPLVLNITNYVTMEYMANVQLAIGASPIMSVCDEELDELISIASTVNINIGTLDEVFIKRCEKAVELAKYHQKPIILDPVGAGASRIRTQTALMLIKEASIVKGNASEIMTLANQKTKTLGVDAINKIEEAKELAIALANQYKITIVVSGPVDFITDGKNELEIPFGSALMSRVTGMGCTLTAVIAAFRGIVKNSFEASSLATLYFGLCGELAEKRARSPGAFRTAFIDALYSADFEQMREIYHAK